MVLGIFFWIGLSIANIYMSVRALRGSVGERFGLGVGAGIVLVAVATSLAVLGLKLFFPGEKGAPTWLGLAITALAALIPVVSLPVLFFAYRRTVDVPAVEEEKASRPFRAWLPAGIVSGILVVVGLGLVIILDSDPW